jgi:hypothetical protein
MASWVHFHVGKTAAFSKENLAFACLIYESNGGEQGIKV